MEYFPQVPSGRWGDGMRGRDRNTSYDWGRDGHSRQWGSSSHWDSHPPPERHRDSYRRRSRSYSPPGRWSVSSIS
ncbi:hypothetical protein E2C01_090809 [Portunus trituberculatus]|uniref:Uncharacterized protein n=1 Tax=Portunus trituberculatus TaxID=210409 RepID=A0A5B7JCD0_PORTR|nr:hypothetical protein [Portunus trituberculatus]